MMRISLREYIVSGELVDSTTPGHHPRYRPDTIPVQFSYYNGQDTDDKLDMHFGDTDGGAPRIEFSRHSTTQIVSKFHQSTKTGNILPGELFRTTNEPTTYKDLFPVVFTPVQTTDLLELFEVFSSVPLEDNLDHPVLTPAQVGSAGTTEEL